MGTTEQIALVADSAFASPSWAGTVFVCAVWSGIVFLVAKYDTNDNAPWVGALLGIPAGLALWYIWLPDSFRGAISVALSAVVLGLTLALWKIPSSRPWQGWLFFTIVLSIIFAATTITYLWPIAGSDYLWLAAPTLAPSAIASGVGLLVARRQRTLRRDEEAAAAAALLASQREDAARAQAKSEEFARLEQTRQRREAHQRDIAEAEEAAIRSAHDQDLKANLTKRKPQLARLRRVLNTLWTEVRGTIGRGVTLVGLAQLTDLSVEQTYAAVCTLEDRMSVTTNSSADRENWTDIWVYLAPKGAKRVEGRGVVKKKVVRSNQELNVGDGAVVGVAALGGGNRVSHTSVEASTGPESIKTILEAVAALRGQLSEAYQIEALDSQVDELKEAKDEPSKRSALGKLKVLASALGPLAKPLLDVVDGILENVNSTA